MEREIMVNLKNITGFVIGSIIIIGVVILLWLYLNAIVWGPYLLSKVSWNA